MIINVSRIDKNAIKHLFYLQSKTKIDFNVKINRHMVFAENVIKMEIGFPLRVGKKLLDKFIVAYICEVYLQHNFSYIIGFLAKVKGPIFFQYKTKRSIYVY